MNVTDRTYPPLTPDAIAGARRLIGVPLRRRPRWTEAGKELIKIIGDDYELLSSILRRIQD